VHRSSPSSRKRDDELDFQRKYKNLGAVFAALLAKSVKAP